MKFISYTLLALSFLLTACETPEPTLDASTDESLKASFDKIKNSLPADKKTEFEEAVRLLVRNQVSFKEALHADDLDQKRIEARAKAAISGKTASQILAEASTLRIEKERREKQQAQVEIHELETKKKQAEAVLEKLTQFEVIRSRFYKHKGSFGRLEPVIELTVKNGTPMPISRVYFKGTLASPERSVPWLVQEFNYSISGGIEPGEESTWKLAPNTFSEWGKVDSPEDAVFTVTVQRIDGADGETLYSFHGFNSIDEKRLSMLKEKYGK